RHARHRPLRGGECRPAGGFHPVAGGCLGRRPVGRRPGGADGGGGRRTERVLSVFPLPPNATIGLVGGGQLGRMSALAAARLGYRCHILTREVDSPAAQVSHGVTISDYAEPVSLREFAAAVDVFSFEFENISAEG